MQSALASVAYQPRFSQRRFVRGGARQRFHKHIWTASGPPPRSAAAASLLLFHFFINTIYWFLLFFPSSSPAQYRGDARPTHYISSKRGRVGGGGPPFASGWGWGYCAALRSPAAGTGAGQRNEYLHICRCIKSLYSAHSFPVKSLSRSGHVVKPHDKRSKFVSARYPVEGETGSLPLERSTRTRGTCSAPSVDFSYCEFWCELRKLLHIGAEFR